MHAAETSRISIAQTHCWPYAKCKLQHVVLAGRLRTDGASAFWGGGMSVPFPVAPVYPPSLPLRMQQDYSLERFSLLVSPLS